MQASIGLTVSCKWLRILPAQPKDERIFYPAVNHHSEKNNVKHQWTKIEFNPTSTQPTTEGTYFLLSIMLDLDALYSETFATPENTSFRHYI